MNTTEKRKIETIINDQVNEARAEYTRKREDEADELEDEIEKRPPADIKKLGAEYLAAKDQQQETEKKLKKLGWNVSYDGSLDIRHDYETKEPSALCRPLVEHRLETAKTCRAFDALARKYALRIYASSDEISEVFAAFTSDLAKLIH